MAMEWLQGSLLSQANPESLDWRQSLRLGARLAEALHHAHSAGVIHRDIKPANIMVLASGEPKIMDFGIAKVETARMKLTATGQSFGTPLYMSPEQAFGHEVDARTDLFSLGAILYWLLTGRLAFGAESMMAIIGRVLHQNPPPPTQGRPEIPRDVDYVIARALAKAPSDRYPNGGAMAEDLADVLDGRPPRHRAAWGGARPPEAALSVPAAASPSVAQGDATRVSSPPAARPERAAPRDPGPRRSRRSSRVFAGLVVGAVLLLGLISPALFEALRRPAAAPAPPPSAEPAESEEALPSPSPSSGLAGLLSALQGEKPAQLAIDFEHALRAGTLKLWVDGELIKEEKVGGRITKKVIGIKLRKGTYHDVLELKPGRHEIQVQVSWDDDERTERIIGTFAPGTTRRLDVNHGRLLKDLTLEWK
jgi:serine/threonine-protein kinase